LPLCNLRRPLYRFAISAVDPRPSRLIHAPISRSCAPILPPQPEFIVTPDVSILPPSSARRAAWPRSPRPRRLAPRPPPPDAPRRPPVLGDPPSALVLVGLGACSLRRVGGGSGGGRGTKQLSRLDFSPLTKIPPNIIDDEDGDGVHAPQLRPFHRVVALRLRPTTHWHRSHRFSCGTPTDKHTWLQTPPASALIRPTSTRPRLPLCSRGGSSL
jgi:hypothetical protein